jgi:ABC-type nitrate/sulfonate/bicarbonate transport system permease component
VKRKSQFIFNQIVDILPPFLILLLFIGIWEVLARTGHISPLFFPAPSNILKTLWHMITSGDMGKNLASSLVRIGWGSLFGIVPGVIIGLAMGWSIRIRKIVDPFIAAIHPIPKIAIFPLIMIVFGIGDISKIAAIAVSAFFPMLINSMAGVRQLNPIYFEVAQNYGSTTWKTFTRIVFPGSLPMILTGARLAINMALVITVSVEMLAATQGLGVLIWFSWETLRTQDLYATLIIIAMVGLAFNFLLQEATVRLTRWHSRTSSEKP